MAIILCGATTRYSTLLCCNCNLMINTPKSFVYASKRMTALIIVCIFVRIFDLQLFYQNSLSWDVYWQPCR